MAAAADVIYRWPTVVGKYRPKTYVREHPGGEIVYTPNAVNVNRRIAGSGNNAPRYYFRLTVRVYLYTRYNRDINISTLLVFIRV